MSPDQQSPESLRTTPLFALHQELGARMVGFAGYAMPVQYPTGVLAEHRHTRERASLFDVSHMGQIRVSGPLAATALEQVLPVDLQGLGLHRMRYALLLAEDGGILDDLMVVRRDDDFLLIVNAARQSDDLAWLQHRIGHACEVHALAEMALLAVQGPDAAAIIQKAIPSASLLVFMQGMAFDIQGHRGYLMRSGYTGEDGYEISIPASVATNLARWLLQQPQVRPAGLGARNTLRLEAGLCLYGTDMGAATSPVAAQLQWSIPPVRRSQGARAGGFPGAQRVLAELDGHNPVPLVRVGLHALERIPVRDGTPLHLPDGPIVGHITSGILSPSLDRPIAMAYVHAAHRSTCTRMDAMVRGKPVPMEIVPLPFVGTRYRKT